MVCKQKQSLCDETPSDCHFELKTFAKGTTGHNDDADINYLIYCQSGSVRISSTLFYDEILHEGEIMFIPRQSECTGTALSDTTVLIHKFNNTVCCSEKCILSYLYTHRHIDTKIYCCKLTAPNSLQALMHSVSSYIDDETHDLHIWHLKHKELIWVFTRYFDPEELAELCGYGVYSFKRIFKKEFGVSVYRWLIMKRAENIKFRLLQESIPLVDIMDEFNFYSVTLFGNFCKKHLGDYPRNLRKNYFATRNIE